MGVTGLSQKGTCEVKDNTILGEKRDSGLPRVRDAAAVGCCEGWMPEATKVDGKIKCMDAAGRNLGA